MLLHGSGLRGWQQDRDVWELIKDVSLCICTDRSHPKITRGTLKPKQSAEAMLTLPSVRGQIDASSSLSFLKVFLDSWDSGLPYDWLVFPPSLQHPLSFRVPLLQSGFGAQEPAQLSRALAFTWDFGSCKKKLLIREWACFLPPWSVHLQDMNLLISSSD